MRLRFPLSRPGFLLILLALAAGVFGMELPPLFRLPVGGRPLAQPLLDSTRKPAALWFLSEDSSIYLLDETGKLALRRAMIAPRPWLGLDPFGRAVLLLDEEAGPTLAVLTRSGNFAWKLPLRDWLRGEAPPDDLSFGPDGRYLLRSGTRLLCLSPSGRALWHFALPAPPSCRAALDVSGNFLFGFNNGKILSLSPYGRVAGNYALPSKSGVTLLGAVAGGALAGQENGGLYFLGGGGAKTWGRMPAVPRAMAAASDRVALLDSKGDLAIFDGKGGQRKNVATGMDEASIMLAVGRVVVTGVGRAASFSMDGQELRAAGITGAVSRALLSESGLLFSAGEDWILGAYRYEGPLVRLSLPPPPPCPADPSSILALGLLDPSAASEDGQLALLADIEKNLDSATMGEDEAGDRALLEEVAKGDSSISELPASRRRFGLFSRPRAEACRLLGKIGSPASIGTLADIAVGGGDPSVRAAAMEAIGAIGVDPAGLAEEALAKAAAGSRLDDEVALALADAIEALALSSGTPPSGAAIRSLVVLAGPPYVGAVRARAEKALESIARGSTLR